MTSPPNALEAARTDARTARAAYEVARRHHAAVVVLREWETANPGAPHPRDATLSADLDSPAVSARALLDAEARLTATAAALARASDALAAARQAAPPDTIDAKREAMVAARARLSAARAHDSKASGVWHKTEEAFLALTVLGTWEQRAAPGAAHPREAELRRAIDAAGLTGTTCETAQPYLLAILRDAVLARDVRREADAAHGAASDAWTAETGGHLRALVDATRAGRPGFRIAEGEMLDMDGQNPEPVFVIDLADHTGGSPWIRYIAIAADLEACIFDAYGDGVYYNYRSLKLPLTPAGP